MRFRKDPGRPRPVGALAECLGGTAGPVDGRRSSLADHLMSASAMFPLKRPSLPRSGRDSRGGAIVRGNLRTLSGTAAAPCDPPHAQTPRHGRPQAAATGVQDPVRGAAARQGAGDQPVFDGHCLIPVDGAGYFSSRSVHRHHCRVASHSDGSKGHSHSMPAAVVRHPDRREAPPLAPEPAARTDGDRRNDRQRNAAARSVDGLRREHPHLKAIVLQDGLASNGPRIARLRRHGLRSVPGGRPGGHALPFASPDASPDTRAARFTDADGALHELRCLNGAPASASRPDIRASVTGCRETVTRRKCIARRHRGPDGPTHRGGGKRKGLPWVTDLPVDGGSPMPVMRAARSRWRTGNGIPARWGTRATAPGPASGTESGA